jgi:hypothetical protein
MMRSFSVFFVTMLVSFAADAADPFVGEWMLDEEFCEEARLFWTADGIHGALSYEDDRWTEILSTPYSREGDVITYSVVPFEIGGSGGAEAVTERIRITMQGSDRLTIENLDLEAPDNTVEYVRCPLR